MELKVWVNGIQRVICGVTEETTCQDVVIALAHAIDCTGRFTLVEKWRQSERLVPPSEYPLKLLRNWGEYAGDVQYLLKYSGDRPRNGDRINGKPQKDSNCKFSHNFSPHSLPYDDHQLSQGSGSSSSSLVGSHYPANNNRANVKRNLTFSGAHHPSDSLSPLGGGNRQRKHQRQRRHETPFENCSLDSVEEQSSLSSHSSNSPYSSFQTGQSVSQNYRHNNNHHSHRQAPDYKHSDIVELTLAETSSVSPAPVTSSPVGTPTPQNGLDGEKPTSGSPSSFSSGQYSNTQHLYTHSRDHLFSPPVRHVKQPSPRPLPSNSPSSNCPQDLHGNSSRHLPTVSPQSPAVSTSTQAKHSHSLQQNQNHWDEQQRNPSEENNVFRNGVGSEVHSNDGQCQHNKGDSSSSSETDENKNNKKMWDVSSLLQSGDMSGVSREELIRLVNLQIQRLTAYEDQVQSINSEICECEERDVENMKTLQQMESESARLTEQETAWETELQELELVSWQDKLQLEQAHQAKLEQEINVLQDKLSKCEVEVASHKQQATHLEGEIDRERKLHVKQSQDSKGKETREIQEVSELRQQIQQKLAEHENNERALEEWNSRCKDLESGISEKKARIPQLERELKEVNLELFNLKPEDPEENQQQHVKLASDSGVTFTRSSSSRVGSSRKIPGKQISLKEAIESEPQGYWV